LFILVEAQQNNLIGKVLLRRLKGDSK